MAAADGVSAHDIGGPGRLDVESPVVLDRSARVATKTASDMRIRRA